MHISIFGLVLLVILLTWSAQRIDDALTGLLKLALWLAGAIAAGVALWFSGKFLLAHPYLLATLVAMFLVAAVAFVKDNRQRKTQRAEYEAMMERAFPMGVSPEQRDARIQKWLDFKPFSGPGHFSASISDESRACAEEWGKRPFLMTVSPKPVYSDSDFEAWRKANL